MTLATAHRIPGTAILCPDGCTEHAAMTPPRCIHGSDATCPTCAEHRALRRLYDGPHDACSLEMAHHHLPENRSATLPVMVDGKQRRPIGMRADVPAVDPRTDLGANGCAARFAYREDAVAAARDWLEPEGWVWRVQYVGRYDLWELMAKRKSWRKPEIHVEACLNPFAPVPGHAHIGTGTPGLVR